MSRPQSHWWQLLLVCGFALVCRLGMVWARGDSLNLDVDAYLEIARHIAAGEGFSRGQPPHPTAFRPPLYPLVLAAIFSLGGAALTIGLVQALLGAVTVGLTCRVGQLLNMGWASLIAGIAVAVDPLLLQYTVLPMTEVLCAALIILWCWLICELQRPIPKPTNLLAWLLQGACLGLLCLCRPAFLAAALFVLAWLAVQEFHQWRVHSQSRAVSTFRPLMLSIIGLGAVIAPWIVRNAIVVGKATAATTHGGYTLLLANNPVFYHEVVSRPWGTTWQRDSLLGWQDELERDMAAEKISPHDEVARDRWMYRRALTHIRQERGLFVRSCLWRAIRFWDLAPWRTPGGYARILVWGTAVFYGLIMCGILIALCQLSRVEWKNWGLLLIVPLTLWVTHWFYWTDMRMRAPVIPVLALLAARGTLPRRSAGDSQSVQIGS